MIAEEAQLMYLSSPDVLIDFEDFKDFDDVFCDVCANGHLEVAQWLLKVKPDVNISADDDWTFCATCQNGHLEVAQWLLSIKPDINISANGEYAFCMACYYGHLEVAQWLLQVVGLASTIPPPLRNETVGIVEAKIGGIDISADNDWTFRMACFEGHVEVAQWLLTLKKNTQTHKQTNKQTNKHNSFKKMN